MRKFNWLIAIAATASLVFTTAASAGDYPTKQVRIIVPYPAGGSSDAVARILAPRLGDLWRQPVIIENRPGAGSITGTMLMTQAPADGYTLGIIANGLTVNPSLHAKLPFDTERDIQPVTQLTFTPNILVACPQTPVKNLTGLIQRIKAGGANFSSGSIGNGTASHLALERLKAAAGVDILHVPFQGLAPGVAAVLGCHTDLMMANLPDVLPYIHSGKLVALAVASPARLASLPNVPTFIESGYPGFVSGAWYGLAVRTGTPEPIVRKLNEEAAAIINRPDVRQQLSGMGLDPVGSSLDDFTKMVRTELKTNAELVKRAGIHAD